MMNQSPDKDMVSRRMARLCAAGCGVLGLWGLMCWALDQPLLSSVFLQYIPMSPRAALGYVVIGSALFLHAHGRQSGAQRLYVMTAAVIAILGGGLSLGESFIRFGSHSPANIFHAPVGFSDYLVVRMSRFSAASLVLGGGGLLLLAGYSRKRWAGLAGIFGAVIGVVNGIILLGYFYRAPLLYGGAIRPVPLLGAVASCFLGLGVVAAAHRDRFPATIFAGPSARAHLLRVFLPITFVVVLLDELLADVFQWYARMNPALQEALQTLLSVFVVTGAVAYLAGKLGRRLDKAEAERNQSEQALRQARDELEIRVRERTATLAAANDELNQEIERRRQSEKTLGESEERSRQLAEAFRQSEARKGALLQASLDAIIAVDHEDRIIEFNSAAEKVFGFHRAEVLGREMASLLIPPHLRELHRQGLARYLASGLGNQLGRRVEMTALRADGNEFPVEFTIQRIDLPGPPMFTAFVRDISDRRQAESQIAMLAQAMESTADPMCITDLEDRFIFVNRAFEKTYGYTDIEILGKTPEILLSRANPPGLLSEIEAQTRLGGWRGEVMDRRKDGSEFPVFLSTSWIKARDGRLVGLVGVAQDITERKRTEEVLRENERRLRLIAENTSDVIFAFDMERRPMFVNSAVKELTGYTFAEIQQRGFINWIHPDDQPRMLKHWEELYVGKGYSEVEFRLVTKSGRVKWCSSTWGPLFDETGRQIGVQGREREITERKRLEGELLEISAKERRRLGHDLHDGLGQYLAGIALKAKVLEENLAEEKSAQALRAKAVVDLINTAIRQTRNLARGLDPVHVEADGVVAALGNLVAQTREMFHLDCTFTCPQDRLAVNLETSLALYRITQEAIHNAVVHAEARRIEIGLVVQEGHLRLSIRDYGKGFSPGTQRESGLGLHIMRYRARSIGGNLTIDSAPKTGTVITCSIPQELCLVKTKGPAD